MKVYINKEGIKVPRPKSLRLEDGLYVPPTDEQLISAGYTIEEIDLVTSEPVSYIPSYEERVVEYIRERYTVDDELAILRQRDRKQEEFEEYDSYCEECKMRARGYNNE